jgi:hypothetical protein
MDALARLNEDGVLLAYHISMIQKKLTKKRGDYDVASQLI